MFANVGNSFQHEKLLIHACPVRLVLFLLICLTLSCVWKIPLVALAKQSLQQSWKPDVENFPVQHMISAFTTHSSHTGPFVILRQESVSESTDLSWWRRDTFIWKMVWGNSVPHTNKNGDCFFFNTTSIYETLCSLGFWGLILFLSLKTFGQTHSENWSCIRKVGSTTNFMKAWAPFVLCKSFWIKIEQN